MRELQPDDLNVELLRRFGISHREMRFVQVHGTSLHPLHVRAQIRASRRQRGDWLSAIPICLRTAAS
jgi:hypothetical protein